MEAAANVRYTTDKKNGAGNETWGVVKERVMGVQT